MLLLSIRKLEKSYGEKDVLRGISFDLEQGERVGLVGLNGCGKSTLLHLVSGVEIPDSGQIDSFFPLHIRCLEQSPELDARTLLGTLEGTFRHILGALRPSDRLRRPSHMLDSPSSDGLSGGERAKLALAEVLAGEPDLLLLDEPTNHLDFEGIQSLIGILSAYSGTVLTVSHDRYFLDCTATRILELEEGRLTEYAGNYTAYREEKARLFTERQHRWEEDRKQRQQVEQAIHQLKDWSSKAHRDSTKKDKSGNTMGLKEYKRAKAKHMDQQIKSQIKRLEKLKDEGETRPQEEKRVFFQVRSDGKRGGRIIEAEGISKSFGENHLFAGSSFVLMRGERIALFGPNGCGKTTLIRMLQGLEAPDSGRLWASPGSPPVVLSQTMGDLPIEKTPLQYYQGLWGSLNGEQRILLANMRLSARHLNQRIGTLSLGERMKVKLAELALSRCDFLILDEPTNFLDLHAREMLEDTLSSYEGTLLAASHDLYFLERVCDKVLLFEDGALQKLEMTFREYMGRRKPCQS